MKLKLKKISSAQYRAGDFTLNKGVCMNHATGRLFYIWRLYREGVYIGSPENVKEAERWINGR